MINCHASSLTLELKDITNVTIQNCTIGNWSFRQVQNISIENVTNTINDGISTSLNFYNSSAFIKNIIIENENLTGHLEGISVQDFSNLHIQQSNFVNNTVNYGLIKVFNLSQLIMSNCSMLENYAEKHAAAIYVNESFVYLNNTCLQNNSAGGYGGVILSMGKSLIDVSYSVFDGNKAAVGGAIYQQTSTMKLNHCSFSGNSDSAIVGFVNNEVSIENSHFENNVGQHYGGTVSMLNHSVLSVSNTTFKNNKRISSTDFIVPQSLKQTSDTNTFTGGGAAIWLSQSIGNILTSGFYNNYASLGGGTVCSLHSSLSISDTTFENNVAGFIAGAIFSSQSFLNIEYSNFKNNSVLNMKSGEGGGLLLTDYSTVKISNVLFSECHARNGGAILANFTQITMSNSYVAANTGSAIYFGDENSVHIDNCTFSNNFIPVNGGAIVCVEYCDVKIINSNFRRNNALRGGGAVYVTKFLKNTSKFTVHNCSFTYNRAFSGGAMTVMHTQMYQFLR